MNIGEMILNEKNNLLYNKSVNIHHNSDVMIKKAVELADELQRNIALANVYYLKTVCGLDYDDAKKASEYFRNIPVECFTEEFIEHYIVCLKLCYQYQEVVNILQKLLSASQSFKCQYFCLRELVDSAMVADGALSKEDYYHYKNRLKELLDNEYKNVEQIIP